MESTLRIVVDNSGAIRDLSRTEKALRDVGSAASGMGGKLRVLDGGLSTAGKKASVLGSGLDEIRSKAAGATPVIGGLVNKLTSMGPVAGIIGTVTLAIAALGAASIKAAAEQQKQLAQLETMTGSAQKAKESYAALVQFAAKTPFDLTQSVEAFTKLRSLGLAATEDRLKSFGNTASAMGKSMNQMIEAVADASTGEFERLKEFGIKSKTEGDKVKFTFQGVSTTVGKNSTEIVKYLENIGKTKFGDAMNKQALTLNGAFSNVKDNFNQMLAAVGSGALAKAVSDISKSLSNGFTTLTPLMASIGNLFGGIISGVGNVLNGLGSLWAGFNGANAASGALQGLTLGFNLLGKGVEVLGSAVGSTFGFIGGLVGQAGDLMRSTFGSLLKDLDIGFESSGRSWGNSIIGVLRAVKAVVAVMPELFKAAILDITDMFKSLGGIVGRLLKGDISALKDVGAAFTGNFNRTGKALDKAGSIASATYADEKGASAAIKRLMGGNSTKAFLDTGKDMSPDKSGAKTGTKTGKSEAEKLADQMADFWKKLDGESKDAEALYKSLSLAATQGRSLSDASEETAKQLEYQRLTGKALSVQDAQRINSALALQRAAKSGTDQLIASEQKLKELAQQGRDTIAEYGTSPKEQRLAELQGKRAGVQAALRESPYDTALLATSNKALAEIDRQIENVGIEFQSQFGRQIEDLGNQFGGKFGAAISSLGRALQQITAITAGDFANGGPFGALAGIASQIAGANSNFSKDLKKGLSGLTEVTEKQGGMFRKLFSPGGSFGEAMGKVLGGAGKGAAIGGAVSDIGGMFGIKLNRGGAQTGGAIGGAIGSVVPVIGTAIGSLVGSIAGGLIKPKNPYADVSLTTSSSGVSGNVFASRKEGSSESGLTLAGGVNDALSQMAQRLGAQVTAGIKLGSIGFSGEQFYFNPNGGDFKGSGAQKFSSGEKAVEAAVLTALKNGAIAGISDFSKRVLGSGQDLEGAFQLAEKYENIVKTLRTFDDPIGSAIGDLNKEMEKFREQMLKNGATTAEMANVDRFYNEKRKELIDNSMSQLKDFQSKLNGEGSGVTGLNRLNSMLNDFSAFERDIASGKQVDQGKFTSLGSNILDVSSRLYGTSTEAFQNIRGRLSSANDGAMGNVQKVIDQNTVLAQATQDNTKYLIDNVQQTIITNEWLANIHSLLQQSAGLRESIANGGWSSGGRNMANDMNQW